MAETRKLRVFLCHSSQDKPVVRELHQRLLSEGWIDVWLDEEKLLPGQNWDYEIEKALGLSDAVIVTLTNQSVNKEGYIQRELRFVLDIALEKPEGTVFILPVRLEECDLPRRLRTYQYADYFPLERRDWAYKRLLAGLQLRASALGIVVSNPLGILPNQNLTERAEYKVKLKSLGRSKIDVIKVIRDLTDLGLADAKTLAETDDAMVLLTADKALALDAKRRLEAAGAIVEIFAS